MSCKEAVLAALKGGPKTPGELKAQLDAFTGGNVDTTLGALKRSGDVTPPKERGGKYSLSRAGGGCRHDTRAERSGRPRPQLPSKATRRSRSCSSCARCT
jgi:hypothetical protein